MKPTRKENKRWRAEDERQTRQAVLTKLALTQVAVLARNAPTTDWETDATLDQWHAIMVTIDALRPVLHRLGGVPLEGDGEP